MARQQISMKQIAIDKSNLTVVIAVSIAVFLTVFSVVASKSLFSQSKYQAKVISKKKIALKQLETNISEVSKLETAYKEFAGSQQNILEGNASGTADRDGENSRIILDALPSKYDFPAVATSLQKLLSSYEVEGITGTDDEVAQSTNQASDSPQPVEMPFSVLVNAPAQDVKPILELFERSIRPVQIQKISLNGDASKLKISVEAKTYFQPAKTFNVKTEALR